MRPDIHLLHKSPAQVVCATLYLHGPPQKIEFGPTRQPRNSIRLHCEIRMQSPQDGKD